MQLESTTSAQFIRVFFDTRSQRQKAYGVSEVSPINTLPTIDTVSGRRRQRSMVSNESRMAYVLTLTPPTPNHLQPAQRFNGETSVHLRR